MVDDRFKDLCPLYAVGALEGEELRQFEAHLRTGCPSCLEELKGYEAVTGLLPYGLPEIPLSPRVKARLLMRLGVVRRPMVRRWPVVAGLLAASIAGIGLVWQTLALKREVVRQTQELAQLRHTLAFLTDPCVLTLNLGGQEMAPQASARLLWLPRTNQVVLLARLLPPLSSEKSYQLWAIAGDNPVSAGVFSVDAEGNALHQVPSMPLSAPVQAFAVTVEPAGGLPQPSGPMVLMGKVSS